MFFRPVFSLTAFILVALVGFALVLLGLKRGTRTSKREAARRATIVALLVFMMAGPSIPGKASDVGSAAEAWIVIDRTGSMAGEDWDGDRPRIEGVKQDVQTILDAMPGARITIMVWDSNVSTVLPLTTDRDAADSYLTNLRQELSDSSHGSTPNRPASALFSALSDAEEQDPDAIRGLFVFSDGESSNEDVWSPIDDMSTSSRGLMSRYVDGGAIIGYGTKEGGPMKVRRLTGDAQERGYTEDSQSGDQAGEVVEDEYIRDGSEPDSPIAITRIDEDALKDIAEQTGLTYIHSPATAEVKQAASTLDENSQVVATQRAQVKAARYLIWPFALFLGGMLQWETAIVAGKARNMRRARAI